jgi:hypothetical protein
MNKCASCGSPTNAIGFCYYCERGLKKSGISSLETLKRLPNAERLTMNLPVAQGIAERLTTRPAMQLHNQ